MEKEKGAVKKVYRPKGRPMSRKHIRISAEKSCAVNSSADLEKSLDSFDEFILADNNYKKRTKRKTVDTSADDTLQDENFLDSFDKFIAAEKRQVDSITMNVNY